LDLLSVTHNHQQPNVVLEAWQISCDLQVGKRLMLLHIQPQCADLDLTTPACLGNFAVRSVPAKFCIQCMGDDRLSLSAVQQAVEMLN